MVYVGFEAAPEADAIPTAGTAINSRALEATAATVLFKRSFISSSSSTVLIHSPETSDFRDHCVSRNQTFAGNRPIWPFDNSSSDLLAHFVHPGEPWPNFFARNASLKVGEQVFDFVRPLRYRTNSCS